VIQSRRPAIATGLAAVAALWLWQFLTVHYNYGGNWTALYMIGPRTPVPQSIADERLYIFQNNYGYDGQSFHLMAHDPWARRNTPAEVDIAPFRYTRILVPALAWILAFGQDRFIDPAYFAVILGFAFLGTYWLAFYAARASRSPAWGLAFVLSPATLTSIDRMTVDIALAALCAAFALYSEPELRNASQTRWKLTLVLACALLTRESAWLLFAVYEVFLFARSRYSDAVFMLTAAIPAVAWQAYIAARAGRAAIPPRVLGWIPFAGFLKRIAHPTSYNLPPGLNAFAISFDYVALAGIALAGALAVALCVRIARREPWTPLSSAICAFALAVFLLRQRFEWEDAYAFGRISAPMLLLIAMQGLRGQTLALAWLGLAPTLLVDSRIALNFGKQAVGVIHGLLHWT
jgi:hypothetical protein